MRNNSKIKIYQRTRGKRAVEPIKIQNSFEQDTIIGWCFVLSVYEWVTLSTKSYWKEIRSFHRCIWDSQDLRLRTINRTEIDKNELEKAYFQHDMAYGTYQDLPRNAASEKYYVIRHFKLLVIHSMKDINEDISPWFTIF